MRKQKLLILASILTTFTTKGSFQLTNSSIEHEYPKAPCPSPVGNHYSSQRSESCSTEAHRNENRSTTKTVTHLLSSHSPLSTTSLFEGSISENPLLSNASLSNTPSYRRFVSAATCSNNWREESKIAANNNAKSIKLPLSKNETIYQATYLAAALRGKNKKQQPLSFSLRAAHLKRSMKEASSYNQNSTHVENLIEEQAFFPELKESISRREELSSSDDTFWPKHKDPAFWDQK